MQDHASPTIRDWILQNGPLVAAGIVLLLAGSYYYLLQKPIKGIPYNASAAWTVLGDLSALDKEGKDDIFGWMMKEAKKFSSPICQLFIIPFGKPLVVLSDYHESYDIMTRRKEWDRSDWSIELFGGAVEKHHINLKTGPAWRAHRRLIQDLMGPKFLHTVAAPNIYQSATRLMALWDTKARVADGRPFAADKDIQYVVLDSVLDFSFGSNYTRRSLPAQIEVAQAMNAKTEANKDENSPAVFPVAPIDGVLTAILQSAVTIGEISNMLFFSWGWWWKNLQPKERNYTAVRRKFLKEQVEKSTAKLKSRNKDSEDDAWVVSATDLMMQRERLFAEKEGREPVYWSQTMHDELLGFMVAGHDTTSTTMCWAIKLIADNQKCQETLRKHLRSAHSKAWEEKRAPTYEEIIKANIPYLDAVMEEILRLDNVFPVVERQCSQDTVVLGHPVPKGTTMIMFTSGPSITEPAYDIDDNLRSNSARDALRDKGKRTWANEGMKEFRPERWLSGRDENGTYDATAGPLLSFGVGPRGCFGRRLAYLQMRFLLTLMLWNFELQPCGEKLSSYEGRLLLTWLPVHCYVKPKRIML